ncbi:MAG: cyclic nucleotide-binding domain-containing protein [Gammaproteobacteria bacterium]|nr:cyclic nucleotide-binding domain-containing protein [Gammaproteobacteria bacterium]
MAKSNTILDKKLLQTLEPLSNLAHDKLEELVNKSVIQDFPPGKLLFKQGDSDSHTFFLINGQVELLEVGQKKNKIIKAKSKDASLPLAQELPRPCSGRTKTETTLVIIDSNLLEILSDDNPSGTFEVEELGGDDGGYWMTRFLQSRAFLKLPTENIQALLMAMEEFPVSKGEVIIHQGAKDDYYYIVQSGKCAVSRRPAPNAEEMQLAILKEGDGFGEESLITNSKRNANITMLEDGILMRVNKKDFLTYLASPLILFTEEKDVLESVGKGSLLIDVRTHEEYHATHVEGSVNIPLSMLRLKVDGLNPTRDYILCCNDATLSSAAAFLLTQHGLTCHVLKGGLKAANIQLPAPNLSVNVAPKDNRKVQAADQKRKVAEEKAEKIQQQAQVAHDQAEQLSKRVAAAEQAQRKAEQEVARLQQEELAQRDNAIRSAKMRIEKEASRARKAEEKAAKLKIEAKAISNKANEELLKAREEAAAVVKRQAALDDSLNHAKEVAAEAEKVAAHARKQAQIEAAQIRQQAEDEAQQLRTEMEETSRKIVADAQRAKEQQEEQRRIAMDAVRKKEQEAEIIRQQAATEAAEMRSAFEAERDQLRRETEEQRQKEETQRRAQHEEEKRKAAADAEAIRHQAQLEAEKMRAELLAAQQEFQESLNQAKTEEQKQRQRMLEEAQEHAQQVIANTTLKAEQEAESIRLRAEQEAEQLHQELESARKQIEESHATVSRVERIKRETLLEESRRQAQALLKQNAEKAAHDAEEIRENALAEAEQLRSELARAREQIEGTVAKAQVLSGQQKQQIISDAQERAQQVINEATMKAEQKAEAIRLLAQEEAEQLRQELERTRMELAEQAAQARQEQAEQVRQAKIKKEQAKKAQLRKQQAKKEDQARMMAEQIRAKLEQAEQERQNQELEKTGEGMALAEVKIKRVDNRIILEGAEDIFIFKEPSVKQDDIPVLNQTSGSQTAQTHEEDELPSFNIEGDDTPAVTPFNAQEFNRARRERDEVIAQATRSKRKGIFAVAASLIVTVAVGATFIVMKPELLDQNMFAQNQGAPKLTAKASINPVSNLKKAIELPSALAIKKEESQLMQEAEATFNKMVDKWKDLVSIETDTIPAVDVDTVPAEEPSTQQEAGQ